MSDKGTSHSQEEVDQAFENALANGYVDLITDDPEDVAYDLIRFNADFEDADPGPLRELVENWQVRKATEQRR